MAMFAKSMCEEKINRCLLEFSANPSLGARLQMMREMGAGKNEAENAEFSSVTDELTGKESFGAEEELLDQAFATGENINQPAVSTEETRVRQSLSTEESTNQPALPAAWSTTGPLVDSAPQQGSEGPRYVNVHR